jgi:hypothetical protein
MALETFANSATTIRTPASAPEGRPAQRPNGRADGRCHHHHLKRLDETGAIVEHGHGGGRLNQPADQGGLGTRLTPKDPVHQEAGDDSGQRVEEVSLRQAHPRDRENPCKTEGVERRHVQGRIVVVESPMSEEHELTSILEPFTLVEDETTLQVDGCIGIEMGEAERRGHQQDDREHDQLAAEATRRFGGVQSRPPESEAEERTGGDQPR